MRGFAGVPERDHTCASTEAPVMLSNTSSKPIVPYGDSGATTLSQSASALPFGKDVSSVIGFAPPGAPPGMVIAPCSFGSVAYLYQVYSKSVVKMRPPAARNSAIA